MNILDIGIVSIVGVFALIGFWVGLFHTLGSLCGTVVGVYLASRYYEPLGQWLVNITGWGENTSRVLMFIATFFVITRAIGVVFWLIGKVGGILLPIPFKKTIDRFLGMIVGALEAVISIGIVLYFIETFPLGAGMMDAIASSVFAPSAILVASILIPLFPDALRALGATVDSIEQSL